MLPAGAQAASWPAAGATPERWGWQPGETGMLPAAVAWSHEGERLATPPLVTGGDGPAAQRVAYGTSDGRVHLRALGSGADIGPAGGTPVADAPVTDPEDALASAFVSTSSASRPGIVFAVHDDGGGVEIARFDEITGERRGPDVAVPGSLGCSEAGAPLLTPVAGDGTRLLFFTMSGSCPAGSGLVRFGVDRDGGLAFAGVGRTPDVAHGVAPALVARAGGYAVAVARRGGIALWEAGSALGGDPSGTVAFGGDETPAALAAGDGVIYALTGGAGVTRLRLAPAAGGGVAGGAEIPGEPIGLAVAFGAERIAAATTAGLSLLALDGLAPVARAPGAAGPVSAGDLYAFAGGQAVRLADGAAEPLGSVPPVAPALAGGYVVFGPSALATRDATAPRVTLERLGARVLEASAADERGIAAVAFRAGGRRVSARPLGSPWAPSRYRARTPALAPGRYRAVAVAGDRAGNRARDARALRVPCGRRVRGTRSMDVLRGRGGRDCLAAGAGADRLAVRGRGPDRVSCGGGRDVVRADRGDRIAPDCERVRLPPA